MLGSVSFALRNKLSINLVQYILSPALPDPYIFKYPFAICSAHDDTQAFMVAYNRTFAAFAAKFGYLSGLSEHNRLCVHESAV